MKCLGRAHILSFPHHENDRNDWKRSLGKIIYYKKKVQSDEVSEKGRGVHINHFIYKLVNKDILKYKLSKTDVLSDLWRCCNTGFAICNFVFLITWKTNSMLLFK